MEAAIVAAEDVNIAEERQIGHIEVVAIFVIAVIIKYIFVSEYYVNILITKLYCIRGSA